MVPIPLASRMVALELGLTRLTRKLSSGSTSPSPLTKTVTVLLTSPGKKVRTVLPMASKSLDWAVTLKVR